MEGLTYRIVPAERGLACDDCGEAWKDITSTQPVHSTDVSLGKKLQYGREVAEITTLIHSIYSDYAPRNLDPVIKKIYKLLERQSNDLAKEAALLKSP